MTEKFHESELTRFYEIPVRIYTDPSDTTVNATGYITYVYKNGSIKFLPEDEFYHHEVPAVYGVVDLISGDMYGSFLRREFIGEADTAVTSKSFQEMSKHVGKHVVVTFDKGSDEKFPVKSTGILHQLFDDGEGVMTVDGHGSKSRVWPVLDVEPTGKAIPVPVENPGYHVDEIEKGEYGTSSKILEEVNELIDAEKQGSKILALVELSDIVGAIIGYLEVNHPDFTVGDVLTMARITERVFKNGHR